MRQTSFAGQKLRPCRQQPAGVWIPDAGRAIPAPAELAESRTLYQDLAFAAASEPSTLVIAALGALGLIGGGSRRRLRPQVETAPSQN